MDDIKIWAPMAIIAVMWFLAGGPIGWHGFQLWGRKRGGKRK